eukprot:1330328-Rhodomonas_salina.1
MPLRLCYANSGTDIAYRLRACYANSGTDVAHRLRACCANSGTEVGYLLRVSYAKSGADIEYRLRACYANSITDIAIGGGVGMRCPYGCFKLEAVEHKYAIVAGHDGQCSYLLRVRYASDDMILRRELGTARVPTHGGGSRGDPREPGARNAGECAQNLVPALARYSFSTGGFVLGGTVGSVLTGEVLRV